MFVVLYTPGYHDAGVNSKAECECLHQISQLNLQELAGAVIYLGLKTVEQHENIVAENYFDFIV